MSHDRLDAYLGTLADVGGSDLHIKVGTPPRMRVDGTLRRLEGEPDLGPEDTLAMAEGVMRPALWKRFCESTDVDFAYSIPGVGRFRANVFRQRGSVSLVFRLVRPSTTDFAGLGLPEVVGRLALQERGLILVTGPTGSGKTTTLASMIQHINANRECHIISIEDPIEVLHSDKLASIEQREIGVDADSFASAMRAAMRQDPDVIFIGEMRDQETVAAALSAAETGHLVLSSLHTIDAAETVNRIVAFFPPHQQQQIRLSLAGAIQGTICQRLVARTDSEGRVPVLEVMVTNGRIQKCILDPSELGAMHEIIADGSYYGMQTFDQSLVKLIEQGVIDLPNAMAAASKPHDLNVMLQERGLVSVGRAAAPRQLTGTG